MSENKLDILMFFSDQHSYLQQGYAGDKIVRTPNLDKLAKEGTVLDNNITSFPLCVPARMSLMSGRLCSNIEVMDNQGTLDSRIPTFAHSLSSVGYETVLCGRMHFVGEDQRHGFKKRIAGDMTPIYYNRPLEAFKKERGVHLNTPQGGLAAVKVIGGGNSPTLEYDRYVVSNALEYLKEDHEDPQFVCVGTYAPHHPYVAPKELYEYYINKVSADDPTLDMPTAQFFKDRFQEKDKEVIKAVRAAYYGLVEFTDQEIGRVYDAFQQYLERTGHEGIFIYCSDHGDHIGSRGWYGKSSFYEESLHTPMLFVGKGIKKGKRVTGSTSLMDLGPTICELTGAPIANHTDGKSFASLLTTDDNGDDRMSISECGGNYRKDGTLAYGQCVKYKNLKFIHYNDGEADALYDIASDPYEEHNIIADYPDLVEKMKALLTSSCADFDKLKKAMDEQKKNLEILKRCDFDSPERWRCPECGRDFPNPMVSSKL